jgi:hypothetical protein
MVISLCSTVFIGYLIVLQVQLYEMSPFLVIVPYLLLMLFIYCLIHAMTANSKKAHRELLQWREPPVGNAAVNNVGADCPESEDSDEREENEDSDDSSDDNSSKSPEECQRRRRHRKNSGHGHGDDEGRLHEPVVIVKPQPASKQQNKQHINRRQSVQHGVELLCQANRELNNETDDGKSNLPRNVVEDYVESELSSSSKISSRKLLQSSSVSHDNQEHSRSCDEEQSLSWDDNSVSSASFSSMSDVE